MDPIENGLSVKEQIADGVTTAIAAAGGHEPIQQRLFELASPRLAESRDARGQVTILRTEQMADIFPSIPGPDKWAEQDNPEVAKGIYKSLDSLLWRYNDMDPNGAIQRRLNEDLGLVLCRTKATPTEQWGVYVTRDLACLKADYVGPIYTQILKNNLRAARRLDVAIHRVPVHANALQGTLVKALKDARKDSLAIVDKAVEDALSLEDEV